MKPIPHLIITVIIAFFSLFALQKLFAYTPELTPLFLGVVLFAGWVVDVDKGMEIYWIAYFFAVLFGYFAGVQLFQTGIASFLVSIGFAIAAALFVRYFREKKNLTHYGYESSAYAIGYGIVALLVLQDAYGAFLCVVLARAHTVTDWVTKDYWEAKGKNASRDFNILTLLSIISAVLTLVLENSVEISEMAGFFVGMFLIFFNTYSLAINLKRERS